MRGLSYLDYFAVFWFAAAWAGYGILIEFSAFGKQSLNQRMDRYRNRWMDEMLAREVRIVDTQIMGSLQNGTAFFASTSLLAIGGAFALLRSTEDVLEIFASLPFGISTTRAEWELKVLGLLVIFIYVFFKFAWSYRLFNYAAILMGAAPPPKQAKTRDAKAVVEHVARMTTLAGRHFNRGQRAFFFALGYLGWFVNAWIFMAATAAVLVVIVVRQFGPAAQDVLGEKTR